MTEPKPHSHYFKPVGHLESIDVYRVIDLFEVRHPALQHALKKVIAAGKRGAKSEEKDAQEAIDSINRFLAMRKEDAEVSSLGQIDVTSLNDSERRYVPSDHVVELEDGSTLTASAGDPHAELRKQWKPGQRWQQMGITRTWSEVATHDGKPNWCAWLEYRRHPDDIKNEFGLWIGVPDWWMRIPEGLVGIKGIKVQVKFRNGDLSDWTSGKFFCWDSPPAHNARIIAYRIAND